MTSGLATTPQRPLFEPPGLDHPAAPLGPLAFLRTLIRNTIEGWPISVFDEPVVRLSFLGREAVFVMDPAKVEAILARTDLFPKAPIIRRVIGPAVGEKSIFTAEAADWRWQRRAASPPFRHEAILSCLPAFHRAADEAIERMAAAQGPVDVAEEMMATTFDVIVETMLSGRAAFDVERFGRLITDYFDTVGWVGAIAVLGLPKWTPFPGKARAMRGNRELRREMTRVIAERRGTPPPAPDLLDFLINARDPVEGRAMTDAELADNLLTFVVAGHETTALALTWTLWLVSKSPDVERRLLAEIAANGGAAAIDAANVDALTYTKQVVQEGMRLYPPAAMIPRIAAEDAEVEGLAIAKGAPVYLPVYAIHRHRLYWDRPGAFDPDRFEPETHKRRPRGVYLPFGGGPRICIGAAFAMVEAVTLLARFVEAFRFEAVGPAPKPVNRLTLRPGGGLTARLEPRAGEASHRSRAHQTGT